MRLGYWVSEKKSKKLNFEEFGVLCRNVGYELVKIDLDLSLEEQGPFDVIIHKLTDVLAKVNEGCVVSELRMQRFQEFTDKHPECIIIDPMESIYKLLDRYEQYKVVQQCDLLGSHVFTPAFVELTTTDVETNKKKLREGKVQYPIVCKPTVAHGSQFSHQMLLVFNDGGLVDIQPPCVAQTFINHGARLYKLFVIGESMQLVERPSLRNLSAGDHKTIFFDAQDVSKPYSCHDLNVLDDELDQGPVKPDLQKMKVLADDLRSHLQMELFGVDVIIDCETEQYGVIDINFFPGYEGVPDFFSLLLKLVQKLLLQKKITNIALGCNNNEDKSNFLQQQQEHKISEQRTVPKNITNVIGHCPSSVLQDSCHKRLKLDQMENGVRSPALSYAAGGDSTAERSNSTRSNGSSTPVVTNGNASLCFCSPSNGYRSVEKETNGTDLGNGLPSLRSNGLIVVDIDRQML